MLWSTGEQDPYDQGQFFGIHFLFVCERSTRFRTGTIENTISGISWIRSIQAWTKKKTSDAGPHSRWTVPFMAGGGLPGAGGTSVSLPRRDAFNPFSARAAGNQGINGGLPVIFSQGIHSIQPDDMVRTLDIQGGNDNRYNDTRHFTQSAGTVFRHT